MTPLSSSRTPQLKDALVALDVIDLRSCSHTARTINTSLLSVIRDALKLALRESEAWDDINDFQRTHGDDYDLIVGLADEESDADGEHLVRVVDVSDGSEDERFPGSSRVECLEAAAMWCRGEMA